MDNLPEILISKASDASHSRRIRRLAANGRLVKLFAGIYTSNLSSPPSVVVLRHWLQIVGHLVTGAVISHRSAFEGQPVDGQLTITYGKTRRTLQLPGLKVEVLPGAGPCGDGRVRDVPYGCLFLSSEPRRILENLQRGRGRLERTIPRASLEAKLETILSLRGEQRFNELRDTCNELAQRMQLTAEYKRLDGIIGALLGSHSAKRLTAAQALARAAGQPYDSARLELFDRLFAVLNREEFQLHADPAPIGIARENFAFFEAYFSNFIEGTTFTVDEAERIIFNGHIIENRSAEVHPFNDGNGRTARLAMNAALSEAQCSRIMIPTIYREDYLLPLKALSNNGDTSPFIASMVKIHRWSASLNYDLAREQIRVQLAACNAFSEDLRNFRLLFPKNISDRASGASTL